LVEPTQSKITTDIKYSFYTPGSLRRKNIWLINLRWISTGAALVYVLLAHTLLPKVIPLGTLLGVIVALGAVNLAYIRYFQVHPPIALKQEEKLVFIQILIDFIILTFLIHYTGGIENPIYFFYIFHIIIASTIFEKPKQPFWVAGIIVVMFTLLTVLEHYEIITHYYIINYSKSTIQLGLSLLVFYVTIFVSSYIGVTLMNRHRKVKNLFYTQNQALKQASETKTKFFRFVSHELKSPIVAVQSSINVVLDVMGTDIPDKAHDMLSRASERSRQMINVLKDLVDISYDRPKSNSQVDLVNPCDYLGKYIENERPHAEEKNITLTQNVCRTRKNFKIDRYILEKIISNLLSNAIRYTPPNGRVTISTNMKNNFWSLIISDTGIGVSDLDQVKIFNEFYRAENAKKFATIGTGLGLNIVKKMVYQLGGTIDLVSKLDHGTIITVRIPIHE